MNIKNKKITLCLSVALALTACGEQESAETYIAQAQKYSNESQYKESIVSLKNAVKLAPKNGEVRFLLGQAYLTLGSALDAVKELEKARELKYKSKKLLPLLARAYLIANDDESILAIEDTDTLADDDKVQYLAYKTLAAIRTQQLDLAEKTSEEAVSLLPANVFSMLSQAYIELAHNEIEKADAIVSKIRSIRDDIPEATMLEAQVATANQDYVKASQQYKRYEKQQPNARIVYLLIADSLLKAERYEEAEKYADAILKSLPNQPLANYVKAAVRFIEKDYQPAVEYAEKAIQGKYLTPHVRLIAGAASYYLGHFEQAHNHLSYISDLLAPEHPARKMYIISQFQLGLIDELTDSLDSFSPKSKEDEQFLSKLSFSLYSVGATKEARALAEKTEKSAEGVPIDDARQGILKLMMNDPTGIENIESALEENPDLEGAELAIAYAALQSGDYDKALTVAKKWQDKHPELAGSYNMLSAVYMAQNKVDLAKEALQTSLTKEVDNIFALTELAKLYFSEGNKEEARKYAQTAVDKYPDNPKALRYYYAAKNDKEALAKIQQAYKKNSDNIDLSLLYVDALINSGDLDQALIVSNAMETSVKTPKKAWLQRIAIYRRQNNQLQMLTSIEKWLQVNPYHIEPILMISDYYVKQRQADKALQYLDKALSDHHKDNLALKIVKIQLLLDNAKLYEAKTFFEDPQFADINPALKSGLEGRIAFLEKDFAKAAKKLTPFYQAFPTSQNAILLSLAYKNNNDNDLARKVLTDHLVKNSKDDRVRLILANGYIVSEPAKAIVEYETLLKTQSKNIIILNNLAWLTMEQGDLDKALEYVQTGYKVAPQVANVVDTYSQILLKRDQKREALLKSKEAYELSKGKDIDIALNYVEILIINSRNNEAKKLLANIEPKSSAQKNKKNKLISQL
ncbi:XrtA/PEP-CTERM system TPR-repeat protein PrsT [Thalassotalea piscium]